MHAWVCSRIIQERKLSRGDLLSFVGSESLSACHPAHSRNDRCAALCCTVAVFVDGVVTVAWIVADMPARSWTVSSVINVFALFSSVAAPRYRLLFDLTVLYGCVLLRGCVAAQTYPLEAHTVVSICKSTQVSLDSAVSSCLELIRPCRVRLLVLRSQSCGGCFTLCRRAASCSLVRELIDWRDRSIMRSPVRLAFVRCVAIAVAGAYISWQVRTVPDRYNETRYIFVAGQTPAGGVGSPPEDSPSSCCSFRLCFCVQCTTSC